MIETTPKFSRKLNPNEKDGERDSLKLSSGPRKLREHELSYFGVNIPKSESNSLQTTPTNTLVINKFTNSITSSPSSSSVSSLKTIAPLTTSAIHHLTTKDHSQHNTKLTKKWQLTNDKPDLLRHSPNEYIQMKSSSAAIKTTSKLQENTKSVGSHSKIKTNQKISIKADKLIVNNEPVYENLKKPLKSYSRKSDLKRDEMILSELSKAADQILSSVSGYTDDDSMDESKKSSLNHASRLQTIQENKSTQKSMQSKAVQVSRNFDESLHRKQLQKTHHQHRTTRISSASSNESLPKGATTTNQKAYSTKRLCSKNHSAIYQNTNQPEVKSSGSLSSNKSASRKKSSGTHRMHRTCSRDTLNSHASSSEDLPNGVELPRRPRRVRPKEKSESQHNTVGSQSDTHNKTSSLRHASTVDRSTCSRKTHSHSRSENKSSSKVNKGSLLIEQQPKIRIKSGVVTTTSSARRGSSRNPETVWK
jgi:hypothetical protein